MLVAKGNKKVKILFYIFVFIFVSTISFFEKTNFFNNKVLFQIDKIEIYGHEKLDYLEMQNKLNILMGRSLLLIKDKDIKKIIDKNDLVKDYIIQKQYPNTISIRLNEVNFVGSLFKGGRKYFLTDNNKLMLFKDSWNNQSLPNIYGKDAEYHFNYFQQLLKSNNFNLDIISSYYFFQVNRWDVVLDNKKVIKFPSNNLKESIKVVNKLLNNEDFHKYSIIDLRIKNKIITQ